MSDTDELLKRHGLSNVATEYGVQPPGARALLESAAKCLARGFVVKTSGEMAAIVDARALLDLVLAK